MFRLETVALVPDDDVSHVKVKPFAGIISTLGCKFLRLYRVAKGFSVKRDWSKWANFIYPMMHHFILYYRAFERT